MPKAQLKVTVAHVSAEHEFCRELIVDLGTTAAEAVELSGFLTEMPGVAVDDLGIFGEPVGQDRELRHGDRVEVYRPLLVDPMEARRRRS